MTKLGADSTTTLNSAGVRGSRMKNTPWAFVNPEATFSLGGLGCPFLSVSSNLGRVRYSGGREPEWHQVSAVAVRIPYCLRRTAHPRRPTPPLPHGGG